MFNRLSKVKTCLIAFAATLASIVVPAASSAQSSFQSPDILVLGDSQISFGSGPAFLDFFEDIKAHCKPNNSQARHLKKLGEMSVAVIGVRSTSLQHWTSRMGASKGSICDVDPKWKVNAGSYGFINQTANKYVQIGQGREYQFCEKGKSPFEAMFRQDYYYPRLLFMTFLGNSSKRWASSVENARADVDETMRQLPSDIPCIFMTTAPPFRQNIVDLRLMAQENLKTAFVEAGARCTFLEGATPETVAANLGNKRYFRLNMEGRVKDPYHPNTKAARNFLEIEMGQICNAIFTQVEQADPRP